MMSIQSWWSFKTQVLEEKKKKLEFFQRRREKIGWKAVGKGLGRPKGQITNLPKSQAPGISSGPK